jgi:hypothetical protein
MCGRIFPTAESVGYDFSSLRDSLWRRRLAGGFPQILQESKPAGETPAPQGRHSNDRWEKFLQIYLITSGVTGHRDEEQ